MDGKIRFEYVTDVNIFDSAEKKFAGFTFNTASYFTGSYLLSLL